MKRPSTLAASRSERGEPRARRSRPHPVERARHVPAWTGREPRSSVKGFRNEAKPERAFSTACGAPHAHFAQAHPPNRRRFVALDADTAAARGARERRGLDLDDGHRLDLDGALGRSPGLELEQALSLNAELFLGAGELAASGACTRRGSLAGHTGTMPQLGSPRAHALPAADRHAWGVSARRRSTTCAWRLSSRTDESRARARSTHSRYTAHHPTTPPRRSAPRL